MLTEDKSVVKDSAIPQHSTSPYRELCKGWVVRLWHSSKVKQGPFRDVVLVGSVRDQGASACLKSFLYLSIDKTSE